MSTTNGNASTTTSVTQPTTTQYINLSDYMYQAFDTTYTPKLASEIGFTPLLTKPTFLHRAGSPLVSINPLTGLYAEAFVSTTGPKQVIIAYEGTQLSEASKQDLGVFSANEIKDDAELFNGQKAASLAGAAAFAQSVVLTAKKMGITQQNIFVTGHSLGAAEADYAASQTGLGGVTFAAPGISTAYTNPNHVVQNSGNVVNYVDAGDPIGNYAADGNNTLAPVLTSNSIQHYGSVVVLPNAGGLSTLQDAAGLYAAAKAEKSTLGEDGALAEAIIVNGQDHLLPQYAKDLGTTVNGVTTPLTLYLSDASGTSGSSFFPSASTSTSQLGVDVSYIAAALTGGGVPQSSSASSSTSHASVLAASSNTSAHAMGVKAHVG